MSAVGVPQAARRLTGEEISQISEATVVAVANQKAARIIKPEDHQNWGNYLMACFGWLPSMIDFYSFLSLYCIFINPFFLSL